MGERGSHDFFGLNHYSTDYVGAQENDTGQAESYFSDREIKEERDPRWNKTGIGWDIVPWGLHSLLKWIHQEYAPPGGIIITENGFGFREDNASSTKRLCDTTRVECMQGYLAQ